MNITIRTFRVLFLMGLLFLALVAAGCGLGQSDAAGSGGGANAAGADAAAADADRLAVEVQTVGRDVISRAISFTGSVQGQADAAVLAKVAAPTKVLEVSANVGEYVEQGQVLIRLDAEDIQHQVNQAQAALTSAEAGLEQARIQYENAKSSLERMESLHEEGAISDQEWESIRSQYDLARAQYESGVPAQVEQARAALSTAQAQLANTVITAPISGAVASRSVDVGDLAAPGNPLMTLVNTDTLYVEGQLSDRQVAQLQVGQAAEVSLEALPRSKIRAEVETISPAANPQTRAFPMKVRLEGNHEGLRPGMFATVEVILEQHENALLIPVESIVQRGGQSVVFVVEDGQARLRPIETGINTGTLAEVRSGVAEGEQVVVTGQGFLQDGMKVLVVGDGGGPAEGAASAGSEDGAASAGSAANPADDGAADEADPSEEDR